jgi:hypothetical protein
MTFELSREQFRTMILYNWKIGLTYKESHARLVQARGNQAPSVRTVLNWFHEFRQSNFSVEDAIHLNHSPTAVTEETFNAVPAVSEDYSNGTCE